jgi:hypothetical protein
MQGINVCFSTTNGWFSRAIRWFSRAPVSHAFITFRDETLEKTFVLEANGRGFMLTPWRRWLDHHQLYSRYRIAAPPGPQMESLRNLSEFLGSQYDYFSLFGFLFRRLFGRMRNPFDDSKKLVCSEAVARFLDDIGHKGLRGFGQHGTWTPGDLLKEAEKRPVFELEESREDTG